MTVEVEFIGKHYIYILFRVVELVDGVLGLLVRGLHCVVSVCVVVRTVLSSRVTFAGNSTWGQPSRVRQTEGGLGEKRSRREVKGSNPIFT